MKQRNRQGTNCNSEPTPTVCLRCQMDRKHQEQGLQRRHNNYANKEPSQSNVQFIRTRRRQHRNKPCDQKARQCADRKGLKKVSYLFPLHAQSPVSRKWQVERAIDCRNLLISHVCQCRSHISADRLDCDNERSTLEVRGRLRLQINPSLIAIQTLTSNSRCMHRHLARPRTRGRLGQCELSEGGAMSMRRTPPSQIRHPFGYSQRLSRWFDLLHQAPYLSHS